MTKTKWNFWFILSMLWFISMFMVTMLATPWEREQLGKQWLFVFGYVTCIINLLGCVYIGALPSSTD